MKVSVHTVIRNEEEILPFYLEHYKTNFPGCVIHIYDNNSTDRSLEICQAAGCVIRYFPTYSEELLREHKNNCWKDSDSDWIIVCDVDELIQITREDLYNLVGVDVVQFKGYNMTKVSNEKSFSDIDHGFSSPPYDKCCLFRSVIPAINYSLGAHMVNLDSVIKLSKYEFDLFHYNKSWFSEENFLKKHNLKEVPYPNFFKDLIKGVKKLK
jgi:glycosyltransferase involved in cell wall biosynthesis